MVYVHVPFCRSFCTYCDFYSEIACRGRDEAAIGSYLDDLCAEAEARRPEIEATRAVNTLYIGGGTPSVLPPSAVRRIAEAAGGGPFDEFTVEVNPEDIVEKGEAYVESLLAAGVNRVSMGVQSLDDGMLRWMNRRHSSDGARRAFSLLRGCGVGNVSVDIIFGVAHLSDAALRSTLEEILRWRPDHISAYQLSVEEGSALGKMVREGRYVEASEDLCRTQYDTICNLLCEAGYVHYEISNWALTGREAMHNSAYWTRQPYVGLGPGAHSFDGMSRSWNSQSLRGWTSESELLGVEEAVEEQIMLGLRTAEGILESLVSTEKADRLIREGAIVRKSGRIRIPEDRFFVSDQIIADLI